jgi:hypothetical protein
MYLARHRDDGGINDRAAARVSMTNGEIGGQS